MTREDYLKELMELKSGSVRAFSTEVDIPYTTIRSILERGVMNAKMDNILKICSGLNISPESLAHFDNSIINKIQKNIVKLDDDRQLNVLDFSETQLKEQENNNKIKFINTTKVAANPSALCYGDTEIEEQNIDDFKKVPTGSEYSIEVLGDSMEPLILNGSEVYFKKQDMIENGEIAIVEVDSNNHEIDGITCKKVLFDYDNKKVILHSLNDKYEDRILLPDQVKIIGKVLFN